VDTIGRVDPIINPYVMTEDIDGCEVEKEKGNSLAQYQNFQKKLLPIQLFVKAINSMKIHRLCS
jgi:hypothetical protein